jgi:hypothetical protein
VALVACCSTKGSKPAPAAELYCSDLFKKSAAYARATCGSWLILSALYGVVEPERVIHPYNFTLAELSKRERESWAWRTEDALAARFPGRVCFVVLGGIHYEAAVERLPHEAPLARLPIGRRLAWLKGALAA